MDHVALNDREFTQFQQLIYRIAGISMSPAKKLMVGGRLAKRIRHYQLDSYDEYYRLVTDKGNTDELQIAVDLLTTNETYFFREPKHFEFLRDDILAGRTDSAPFRVWSAASSSGQEAYSTAMVLADRLDGRPWEIVGSDISTRVLETARRGLFPMEQARHIPEHYLSRFCLKGVGDSHGTFLVDKPLRERVSFRQANLNTELPQLGNFDLVFLRNVMIYFNGDTKGKVVNRIYDRIKPGGYLFIGHSETLNGCAHRFQAVCPSIYRKPG